MEKVSIHAFWLCPRAQALWSTLLLIRYGDPTARRIDYIGPLQSTEQSRPASWMLQAPQWTGTSFDNIATKGGFSFDPLDSASLDGAMRRTPPMSHFQALATYHAHRRHTLRASVYEALVKQCRQAIPRFVLFDGAARMDTECGGSGAIAMSLHAPLLSEYDAHYLSTATTNNIAEYDGLVRALTLAATMRLTHVQVNGDSNLLMNHMRGLHRVRHPGLRDFYIQARTLAAPDDCRDFGTHATRRPLSPSEKATFYDYLDLDLQHHPG
ncbi:hypothetical protein H257_07190 [Aphanomyces astaci]|uniref:RNase H type-1 domain-containing protein n=1 Tax=Aphanomyces astaci TaxID=112090 RepID=W4GJY9_APHAT|nr:hypothetical protein H257_07190 [Aphanomyces astaci]ETV79997.1 hypothetical protein H257_07190 [Aphanomyces astaci]|eukprot:XP_009830933.1 hypothetical protein H257_07190 [Aphanomyces astaci]